MLGHVAPLVPPARGLRWAEQTVMKERYPRLQVLLRGGDAPRRSLSASGRSRSGRGILLRPSATCKRSFIFGNDRFASGGRGALLARTVVSHYSNQTLNTREHTGE